MDLGKIVLYGVLALVALWLVSLVFRVVAGFVVFLLPIVLLGVIVYVAGRALGLIKS